MSYILRKFSAFLESKVKASYLFVSSDISVISLLKTSLSFWVSLVGPGFESYGRIDFPTTGKF
jgi:hypothetical protein